MHQEFVAWADGGVDSRTPGEIFAVELTADDVGDVSMIPDAGVFRVSLRRRPPGSEQLVSLSSDLTVWLR
jgi:hypothetical protein